MRIFEVTGDKGPKSLLPRSVPQLQPVGLILMRNIPDEKIDPDGGLNCEHTYIIGFLEFVIDEPINN